MGMGLGTHGGVCMVCASTPPFLILMQSPLYAALDEGLAGTATIRAFRAAPRLQAAQTPLTLTLILTPNPCSNPNSNPNP